MSAISTSTLRFLKDLKANNNKEWFLENKQRYEDARVEFTAFVDDLIRLIAKFDPAIAHHQAKDCVFRIYRDVRFSKDKSPYKAHLGAHITSAESRSEIHTRAGYYLHIEPGATILAGGAYLPEGPWLKAIRQEIDYNAAGFQKLIGSKSFREYFREVQGEKLKTTPKGYDAGHPQIEWLRHKSFLAVHDCADKQVTSADFLQHCGKVYKALKPFDDFLNEAKG
ncbi:MAG: DUF2461 domain-containing protein [Flavobacteriales bacterium]|nr:DUF2461 domain-containing protein [Flavobacteriales bacterium]MCB9448140.1 DUF2461 domain-containing protein [Flavobacteriales bacterium]